MAGLAEWEKPRSYYLDDGEEHDWHPAFLAMLARALEKISGKA